MKALRLTASTVVFLSVVASTMLVFSQASTEGAALPKIHRFQPPVSARSADALPTNDVANPGELSESALRQIDALEEDKQARTPTQRKISSRLIYTARMLQGQSAAPGIPVLYTNLELDEQNNLFVDIAADVSDDLLQRLRALGVLIIRSDPAYRSIRAFISPYRLETVAAFPDVIFIGPRRQSMTVGAQNDFRDLFRTPTSRGFGQRAASLREKLSAQLASNGLGVTCTGRGSVTSEGYATHRVADTCASFGVTGTGVKIGVLSDGVTSLAQSQASGDLPADVTVLAGQSGIGDEGTAMLEIIHDLAPDAKLYFATAFTSIESFAQNIVALRAAGCDIIVDDVVYFVEPPFQDGQAPSVNSPHNGGVVTQAVNDVTTDGAMYFSAAGNEAYKDGGFAQTYEGDFTDGGSNSLLPRAGKVHKFGTTAYNAATATVGGGGQISLYWTDPLGGSANDYDLFVLNSAGTQTVDGSTDLQTGTQDPVEGGSGNVLVFPGERVVVFKVTAAANRFFHLIGFGARFTVTTQGAVLGHAGATGAFAIGATPAATGICAPPTCPQGPFPNPFNTTNIVEPYSSDGPRRIFFHADGTPITPGNFSSSGGAVLPKPEFTAADGVSVTGVGGFGSPFYGTSAAAPHAAAIAALVKSVDSTLTNSEIAGFLTSSAVDIMGAGKDRDSGSGIIMAFEAVKAALAPALATLSPNNGNVGTLVTISGKNFGATPGTVTFNGTTATPTIWTPTSITVPVPAGATNGNVVVTVAGSASNGLLFTFTPSITSLSANSAPAGVSVTVTGTNFGSTQGTSKVTFNGKTATVVTWSATSIVVNVPVGGTGNVVVTINSITSNGMAFTVQDYSVPATLTDVTVTAGGSQSQNFTVTPGTSFDAAITFACSGLPSKSSCTFTPPSATPGGTPVDVAMQVSTTAAITSGAGMAMFGMWLPFGGFGLVLVMGVGTGRRSRKALAALGLFLLIPLLLTITSCGGGGSSHTTTPGTPPGTYTVTMRATSGPTSHSSTFKLTVN
jgi:hypothetical protein